ncbi:arylsulfatase [Aestuariibaculum sp. M13]|uniref:sulfatase family protein n=1 Tax=Aestuariibaculum sp. M13 TaxID=2967132 RepID=UPI002159DF68|nr:arylsulfatase [Aestuariibaculum sp. M13]MCR8667674.1 arylsulfatase [Aestuariibaculum sp. M13]
MRVLKLVQLVFISSLLTGCIKKTDKSKPNIVIIYADDMGYGDLNIQNPNSKIPTPHLDNLAKEGIRFTDAHSSSGICSPSRFALLTGTYHWRRQHGIVGSFGKPFFKDSDVTLPQVLKTKDYTTACIGKWHLGWDWQLKQESQSKEGKVNEYLPEDIDWSQPIKGGPLDRGFDYYFGDGTINFPPYAWVENVKVLEAPTEKMTRENIGFEIKEGKWEFRPGPRVKGWNPYNVLPTLTRKTTEWINKQKGNQPFFLYFALPSPHAPIIPNDEFDGKSKAGAYGDYMVQTDWVVGQVLKALKNNGFEDNTIVIFSADNGPEHYAWQRAVEYDHYSMGKFRGLKRDVWEGGHHVPLIMKWPDHIKASLVTDEVVSQVDIMATLSKIVGADLPDNAAPDSYNLLPLLNGEEYQKPLREATVHNTFDSKWGIRKGDWIYINSSSGGHRDMPEAFKNLTGYTDFDTEGILFNMKNDPEQRTNLYNEYPEKIKELEVLLETYRNQGFSVNRTTTSSK